MTGLAYGLAKDNITKIEKWNAKSIVLKKGSNSDVFSSMMDKKVLDRFKEYNYTPINASRTIAYKNGNLNKEDNINVAIIGVSEDNHIKLDILEGDNPKNENEILASISLKNENGLKIGDKLELSTNNRLYTIVGFTEKSK